MKKLFVILGILLLTACGTREIEFTGLDGSDGLVGPQGEQGEMGPAGADGADGLNSLITFTRLNSCELQFDGPTTYALTTEVEECIPSTEICESGSGFMFSSGLDANRNGILDLDEIEPLSVAVVCDGASGPMGPQGAIGPAGADGIDGIDGQDGADGQDGEDGADGQDGEDGADGQDGEDGADGQDGEDGADGVDGLTGPAGPEGPTGPQGPQGPAGTGADFSVTCLSSSCKSLGDGFYAKASGSTAKIYTSSSCHSWYQVAGLNENSDEIFISGDIMFIIEVSSSVKLYKLEF